jgi:DNA repair protein RadC
MLELPTHDARLPQTRPTHSLNLRERSLRYGVGVLSDSDLLALVLSSGTAASSVTEIAGRLLTEAEGLSGIARLGAAGLVDHHGVGPAKAARVAAAVELGQRVFQELVDAERPVLVSVDDVARWARPRLAVLEHEEVWLLSLDGQNGLLAARRVAQGGLHGCALTPSDVLRPAVRAAASAIILLHNHPSGSAEPSPEDVEMTQELGVASRLLGIPLLDHVIIARKRACSLAELGVIR